MPRRVGDWHRRPDRAAAAAPGRWARGDRPRDVRVPGGRPVAILLGLIGLTTTLCAIGLAMMPAADEPNKPLTVLKIIGLTETLLATGWAIDALSKRRAARAIA